MRKNPADAYVEDFDDSVDYFKAVLIDHELSDHYLGAQIEKMTGAYEKEILFLNQSNLIIEFCKACDDFHRGLLQQKPFWIVVAESFYEDKGILRAVRKLADSMSSALYMDAEGSMVFPEIQEPSVRIMDVLDKMPKDYDHEGLEQDIVICLVRHISRSCQNYVQEYL